MPKRTNLFQQVVSVIYEHLAEGASIEESAMLPNRLTGKMREVDVVLRTLAAGHAVVIGIEAASRQPDPISVEWVEQMIAKHQNLPTDKVVLVSESGFTDQARDLAIKENIDPISPETLGDGDPAFWIVNAVRSLWPKQLELTPWRARVFVDRPGEGVKWFHAPQDLDIFIQEGVGMDLGTLISALVEGPFLWDRINEQIGLTAIAQDMETYVNCGTGPGFTLDFDGRPHSLYVRHDDGEKCDLQRIDSIEITMKVDVHVNEAISLQHRRLAEINANYAFGEGAIGGTAALIVATECEEGGKLSIRLNPKHKNKKNKK
ncbi:hypothetical protein [Mycobacterium sp. AZCC_0083]|uniref:hypothetical protein n=1 Tax=Mycobacterium sp. AZCC_0083 TaxID=2735882 RepID=UPI00160D2364|nr:hypothetical protein [Mycobacterium sp. AZCC_0083]MBB5166270.1 hypothetical protein [Mycobacterium sp. AZCC_0083]